MHEPMNVVLGPMRPGGPGGGADAASGSEAPSEVTEAIQASAEFTDLCPPSSVVMARPVDQRHG